jgi:hypothetical protein
MITLFYRKPRYQALRRPWVRGLGHWGVSASRVISATLGLSVVAGALIACLPGERGSLFAERRYAAAGAARRRSGRLSAHRRSGPVGAALGGSDYLHPDCGTGRTRRCLAAVVGMPAPKVFG